LEHKHREPSFLFSNSETNLSKCGDIVEWQQADFLPQGSYDGVRVIIENIQSDFSARLTEIEQEEFKSIGLIDVYDSLSPIQDDQARRKTMRNVMRAKRFLEAMDEFGKTFEIFLNNNPPLSFILGANESLSPGKSLMLSLLLGPMVSVRYS
jgi:hypothetical protein